MLLNISSEETLKEIMNYINGQISSMPLGSFNGVISILIAIIISESLTKKCFSEILNIGLTIVLLKIYFRNLFQKFIYHHKINRNKF